MNGILTPVHTPPPTSFYSFPPSIKEDSIKESKKEVQNLSYPYFTKCIKSELSDCDLFSCYCQNCINQFFESPKDDSKKDLIKESKKEVQNLSYPYFTKCIKSELSNSDLFSCHCENCINEFFKK